MSYVREGDFRLQNVKVTDHKNGIKHTLRLGRRISLNSMFSDGRVIAKQYQPIRNS